MKNPANRTLRWHVYSDADALAARVAHILLRIAEEAIHTRGRFKIVLAGGRTPRAIYERLGETYAEWTAWDIYFGDERCLPPEHHERNSHMAEKAWLQHVSIPRQQIHPIPAERGSDAAAEAYRSAITPILPFDVVMLGLGEDGHTASLFPGHSSSAEALVVPVHDAPKPPAERVSLTCRSLSRARQVFFLVTGSSKQPAIKAWLNGEPIPAAAIVPEDGVDIFLDTPAWSDSSGS